DYHGSSLLCLTNESIGTATASLAAVNDRLGIGRGRSERRIGGPYADRVVVVDRNLVNVREHLELEARRAVRREPLARARHAPARAPDPAAVVARGPRVERVHFLELPHAAFLHRFVLVDRRAERRARA